MLISLTKWSLLKVLIKMLNAIDIFDKVLK